MVGRISERKRERRAKRLRVTDAVHENSLRERGSRMRRRREVAKEALAEEG